jgi:CMP/dCMP kinase
VRGLRGRSQAKRERTAMIVTISREYGAGGLAIGERVAALLGYEFVTDQIPATVAARLGTSSEEVDARAESPPPLPERILVGLSDATPDVLGPASPIGAFDFDESVRREIEKAMRERAARGDVVLLGRVGNAVLAGMPGLVRAFVYAAREWRLAHIMETFGMNRAKASAEVDRIDAERRRFSAERYKVVWGDARYYDVIVDASRLGIDGAAATIAAAALAREAVEA